ncbi:MAG: hypothetical protein EHM34_03365 [Nitrosopumilales archaeon]|nr:MAG: hypothetical protein EHM34_03365 [Nitrosopumilales archaeon]
MWDWKKIKGIENLPPFNKVVALYWEKDGNKYATTGSLKSIDANGAHWTFGQSLDLFDMFNLPDKNGDKPTHWCEIEIPAPENPVEGDLSGLSPFELSCDAVCDEILKTEGSLERIGVLKRWYYHKRNQ